MPIAPQTYRPKRARTRAQVNREADQRRGSARLRGYGVRWDRASLHYRMAHPLCCGCKALGTIAQTDVTDHIIPHQGNMLLFWDEDNWQPACRWHHNVVKQKLEALFAQGKASKDDLHLDSAKAIEIAKECAGWGGV